MVTSRISTTFSLDFSWIPPDDRNAWDKVKQAASIVKKRLEEIDRQIWCEALFLEVHDESYTTWMYICIYMHIYIIIFIFIVITIVIITFIMMMIIMTIVIIIVLLFLIIIIIITHTHIYTHCRCIVI